MDYRFQPKGLRSDLGWYDRGYIPHFDGGQVSQFLTFRLFDSLPESVLQDWREKTSRQGEEGKVIFRKNVENYLDKGSGSCFLRDERVAKLTEDSVLFHHTKKYDLVAWVIMPNHIHFLATPVEGVELSTITHSIKSTRRMKLTRCWVVRDNFGNTSLLTAIFVIENILLASSGTLKTIQ